LLIGVISDTHGLIRPEALAALQESDLIIHAGDIGDLAVLEALEAIAPVIAVKGNIDKREWAKKLPDVRVVEADSARIYVIHSLEELKIDPVVESFQMIIYGHSHIPSVREQDGVIYLNPGSAGPRRFNLPVSVARAEVSMAEIDVRIVRLEIGAKAMKKKLDHLFRES
jgi:hypothetical protein